MIKRYTLPRMGAVWTEENKFNKWLEIELLATEAFVRQKKVPASAYKIIRRKARFSVARIKKLEQSSGHDLIAFLNNLQENIGPSSKYLHWGMTSYDVEDTALSCRLKESAEIIQKDLHNLAIALKRRALQYKRTPCIGRTHGVQAEPTSFGLKLALWYSDTRRNLKRLENATEIISVGRLSGSVGNYANLDPSIETYVCRKLGLKPAAISTQVLQRDRHAEFLNTLAVISATAEKIATEIRNLQRTELAEAEEPFSKNQKGSSSMPHKRNPIGCERISGLARLVRSNAVAGLENIALWHERDITHSSVERVILPDSCILVDYILVLLTDIILRLSVHPQNMLTNLNRTGGLVFSQRILSELVAKGLSRTQAYNLVQQIARQSLKKNNFEELVLTSSHLKKYLTPKELKQCFDLNFYLRRVDYIYKKVFSRNIS